MELKIKDNSMINKLIFTTLFLASTAVSASSISVDMKDVNSGKTLGSILIEQNEYGVVFTPN
jgi:Cu-Zn family superoxide dismutase